MTKISSRANIAPFLAMEMAREADKRAAAGQSIVRFDVGQPSVGSPPAALAAVRAKLDTHPLGYTEGLGTRALRSRIAQMYRDTHDIDLGPERIAITVGASGAFLLAFLALFETGDRVAIAAPGYPPYRHILSALGMHAANAEAGANEHYQLAPHHIAALAREGPLAGALVASPANPTGAMLSRDELAALADACRIENAALISDEIYHGLVYEGAATTALAVAPDAIVINSFSKYWAMTGWRIGWIVAPEHVITAMERLAQNLFISAPGAAQVAALAALDATDVCEQRREGYARNRALLLNALPQLNLGLVAPPHGAFYMLLDISAHLRDDGDSSLAFTRRALEEAGVALTTGVDFDEARGRHWVRLAYARQTAEVEDGIARLTKWLAR